MRLTFTPMPRSPFTTDSLAEQVSGPVRTVTSFSPSCGSAWYVGAE